MMNKRGISAVIATALLLLLTIVIISIIAGVVVPFVRNSLEGTNCLNFREYYKFEEDLGFNCYDLNDLHGFSVKAKVGDQDSRVVEGFDLVLKQAGSGKKVSIRQGAIGGCTAEETYMLNRPCSDIYEIPGEDNFTTISYVYNSSTGRYNEIEIYPVLEEEEICEESDSIRLSLCDPSVILS